MTVVDDGPWPRDRGLAGPASAPSDVPSGAESHLIDEELPPSRVWIQIAEQLRAEGLIR